VQPFSFFAVKVLTNAKTKHISFPYSLFWGNFLGQIAHFFPSLLDSDFGLLLVFLLILKFVK
jgi:hypothetical protein